MEQFHDHIERAMADTDSKYRFIQVVSIQTLDLKQKGKTSRASEHREDRFIEFAEENKLIIANTLFQKPADTGLRNRETRNQNRFCIE